MVLQGALAVAVFAAVSLLCWRSRWAGLGMGVAVGLVSAMALRFGGEASTAFVAMAIAGLCLAAPVVLVALFRGGFNPGQAEVEGR